LDNILERKWALHACSALKGDGIISIIKLLNLYIIGIEEGIQWLMELIAA
jgi:hypothetical protein